jgi:hypothetical protein
MSRALTRPRKSAKLLPAVKYALVASLVAAPIVGKTKKARRAMYAAEQRRVRMAIRKLKGGEQ